MPLSLVREHFGREKEKRRKGQAKPLVLQGCRVYDTDSGTLMLNGSIMTIIIEGNTIFDVGPTITLQSSIPPNAEMIDVGGSIVMPGLLDAHVHVTACSANLPGLLTLPESLVALKAERVMEGMLLRGFTTVRDAGGADFGLAQASDEGVILGPRVLFSGHALSQTGGHGDMRGKAEDGCPCACGAALRGIGRVCDGVPEVRRAARDELRKGAHMIKVMASGGVASPTDKLESTQFSLEELIAAVDEAEAAGSYVCAHAYTSKAIARAVKCGVRSIEHGNLVDQPTALLMKERGCFLVPTIITYEALRDKGAAAGMAPDLVAKVGDLVERGVDSLRVAQQAGVTMVYGSDLLGELHQMQSREFVLRSRVLDPAEVIRHATVNAAALFRVPGTTGRVEKGSRADLLVLTGKVSPADDLSVLVESNFRLVVKEGIVAATDGSFEGGSGLQ